MAINGFRFLFFVLLSYQSNDKFIKNINEYKGWRRGGYGQVYFYMVCIALRKRTDGKTTEGC